MKQQKRHRTNLISCIILLVTAGVMIFLSIVLYNQQKLEIRFDTLVKWLEQIDEAIVKLDSHYEIIISIFALYIAKCQLPIPMSFLCVISGMVFPPMQAVAINLVFTAFFFTVKYFEGQFIGGGWTGMILGLKRMHFIRDWIQFKGTGNPYVLFVTRLVPSIPLGMVSKYYGSMRYDFVYYTLISLLGFAPRLSIYTLIGSEIYNPFSVRFITLLMIISAFTGGSVLLFNMYYGRKSKQMNQTLLIYSEKEKYKIVL